MLAIEIETVSSPADDAHDLACEIFLDEVVRFIATLGLDEFEVDAIDQRLAAFENSVGFKAVAPRGATVNVSAVVAHARAAVLAAAFGCEQPAALA